MQNKVSSTGARKSKMETHRITVDKMKNGFTVKVHKRPAPGTSREAMNSMMFDGDGDEPPQVFTKHAPAHKAIQAAMASMHPQLPPPGMPDAGPPDVPPAGAPPAAPGE